MYNSEMKVLPNQKKKKKKLSPNQRKLRSHEGGG